MIDTDEGFAYREAQDVFLELTPEQFQILWEAYPTPVKTRVCIGPFKSSLYTAMISLDRIVSLEDKE